jgi:hypothetical protein
MAGRVEAGVVNVLLYGDPAFPRSSRVRSSRPPYRCSIRLLDPCRSLPECGDGVAELPEQCDDANTDRATAAPRRARSRLRQRPDRLRRDVRSARLDRCDATCRVIPQPVVLIPGPSSRTACQAEWELALANPAVNPASSLPKSTQSCVDGDPTCDHDAGNDGRCTIRTRLCLRVQDSRLPACVPLAIDRVQLKWPRPLDPVDAVDAVNVAACAAPSRRSA